MATKKGTMPNPTKQKHPGKGRPAKGYDVQTKTWKKGE